MAISKMLTIDKTEGVTVVSLGESASSIQGIISEEIAPALLEEAAAESPHLLIDLSRVDFFNSSFIELLVRVWNRVKARPGGKFAICGLQPYCKEILDITNLTMVWKIYPTREDAIAAMQVE